jgi:hypothetical protein
MPRGIACATVNSQLHICWATRDGHIYHTIRDPSRGWAPWGDVEKVIGRDVTDEAEAICCAESGGDLHLMVIDENGRVWHTIRHSDQPGIPAHWDAWEDVEGRTGRPP